MTNQDTQKSYYQGRSDVSILLRLGLSLTFVEAAIKHLGFSRKAEQLSHTEIYWYCKGVRDQINRARADSRKETEPA